MSDFFFVCVSDSSCCIRALDPVWEWLPCGCFSGLGKISRNCTEDGWSEPYPHYVEACLSEENTTKPVRLGWNANQNKTHTDYIIRTNSCGLYLMLGSYIRKVTQLFSKFSKRLQIFKRFGTRCAMWHHHKTYSLCFTYINHIQINEGGDGNHWNKHLTTWLPSFLSLFSSLQNSTWSSAGWYFFLT